MNRLHVKLLSIAAIILSISAFALPVAAEPEEEDAGEAPFKFEGRHVPEILVRAELVKINCLGDVYSIEELKKHYSRMTPEQLKKKVSEPRSYDFKIDYVYKGDPLLVGTVLKERCKVREMRASDHPAVVKGYDIGAASIWALKYFRDKLIAHPDKEIPWAWWPIDYYHKYRGAHYEHALIWAKAVEKIDKAAPDEKLPMLKKLALGKADDLACMAINVINDAEAPGLDSYLRELIALAPKDELSPGAEAALDEILTKKKWEGWAVSKDRLAMLESWTGGEITDYRLRPIQRRLRDIGREVDIDLDAYYSLVRDVVYNEDIPVGLRTGFISMFYYLRTARHREHMFPFLIEAVDTLKEPELKASAAEYILKIFDTSDYTQGFLRQEESEKVRESLRSIKDDVKYVSAQMHLDRVLYAYLRTEWRPSAERKELLKSWLGDDVPGKEVTAALRRFEKERVFNPDFDSSGLVESLKRQYLRRDPSDVCRTKCLEFTGYIWYWNPYEYGLFEFFVKVLSNPDERENHRRSAAHSLKQHPPESEAHRKAIKELIEKEASERVLEYLKEALAPEPK